MGARCPALSAVPGSGCMRAADAPLAACLLFTIGYFHVAGVPGDGQALRLWPRLWLRRFLLATRTAHGRAVPFGDLLKLGAAGGESCRLQPRLAFAAKARVGLAHGPAIGLTAF